MIETNREQQQQEMISQQVSHPHPHTEGRAIGTIGNVGPTITCNICDAMYAPAPQQVPFLQYTQGALEAAFMGMCHFCFRCRRAACPQCWDEVHSVCGSCVQEAGLPFRAGATPLDGLMFPPAAQASSSLSQAQSSSLFVPVSNGRFYVETQEKLEPARIEITEITTGHAPAVQPAAARTGAPAGQGTDRHQDDARTPPTEAATKTGENQATGKGQVDTPAAVAIPVNAPLPKDAQDTHGPEDMPRTAKKARKAGRLEQVLTWVVLVIVLVLVVVIALAEFIPAVNTLVVRVTHIDIHAEIAYLVHIVQQLFKR